MTSYYGLSFEAERLKIKNSTVPQFQKIDFNNQRLSLKSDPDFLEECSKVVDSKDVKDQDEIDTAESPSYLGMEIRLPRGTDGELEHATVKREIE